MNANCAVPTNDARRTSGTDLGENYPVPDRMLRVPGQRAALFSRRARYPMTTRTFCIVATLFLWTPLINSPAAAESYGIFKSDDGGQVFALAEVEGVLFAALYNRGLYALGAKDHSWSRIRGVQPLVLANAGGTLIVGHNPGGLYWSRDLGITWSKGIATVDTPSLLGATLAADSGELSAEAPVWEIGSNGSLVFAGASAGIYYSGDSGRHWARARQGLPEESPGIAFLVKQEFILAATPIKAKNGEPAAGHSGHGQE